MPASKTAMLGFGETTVTIGRIGHGLMNMSPENLSRSVTTIAATLAPGGKKMDLFQMARVPTNVTFEEAFGTQIHPISVVEIEARDRDRRGLLSGTIKSLDDIPAGDYRRKLTRFQEEAFAHNAEIAEAFGAVAVRKDVTASQLALAWVLCLGPHMVPIPGTSSATRHLENIAAADVELSAEDLAEISKVLEKGGAASWTHG
ncbi:Aldo/keto reductase [Epithele typhae]|uniref:Aldo/keto reductase n=1 Tax=Epithele typhae TaxID=378194 RepID=UPI0020077FA8|nr:Aldo/keto reductase [Epithele typhae]KAH9929055.1 Aldo/keto reductase [Epithele typhae]